MNILIVGNGFDLAHGLPTAYADFLKAKAFDEKLRDNKWMKYFLSMKNDADGIGKTWIDFEGEIEKTLERIIKLPNINPRDSQRKSLYDTLQITELMNDSSIQADYADKEKYVKCLVEDLNSLETSLEEYMAGINYSIVSTRIQEIQNLSVDKLLSFNYTNTYTMLYDKHGKLRNDDCCYIHGVVGAGNLILGYQRKTTGINEQSEEGLLDIRFRKYYQRILKETGNIYRDWLEEDSVNIYVFGFSLAMSDRDTIREFMRAPNVERVTIFYHCEDSHAQLIENLVRVLGEDRVIEMVYDKKIVFKRQQNSIPIYVS